MHRTSDYSILKTGHGLVFLHSKTPHVVTMLWLDSDNVVTIHLLVALVEGYKTAYLCHLDSYTVTVCIRYLVSSHAVTAVAY